MFVPLSRFQSLLFVEEPTFQTAKEMPDVSPTSKARILAKMVTMDSEPRDK